jgi:2-polyprenyl-3-methyl-5-hydroxy-6-metoxy-1,4-benzoquinol methylase
MFFQWNSRKIRSGTGLFPAVTRCQLDTRQFFMSLPSSRPDSGSPDETEVETARLRKANARLRERVELLERTLERVSSDTQVAWLYRNRNERMDPTVDIFAPARARFHSARYEFAAARVSGLAVADIACGTGYGCEILLKQGRAASVTGIDVSPEAIAYAQDRHGGDGIRFRVADALETGLPDGSVDAVVSFETIEHVASAEALVSEFARILTPAGLLICSTPNAWPLEIAPHHVREFDRASFLATLGSEFHVEELFNQNSGSDFAYNRGQPERIVPTSDANHELAECFIAVARKTARSVHA